MPHTQKVNMHKQMLRAQMDIGLHISNETYSDFVQCNPDDEFRFVLQRYMVEEWYNESQREEWYNESQRRINECT